MEHHFLSIDATDDTVAPPLGVHRTARPDDYPQTLDALLDHNARREFNEADYQEPIR
ncbi:MAG: hypothetical protein Q4F65_01005 [Propionibacteriaceae bacterium]|nr:hypothetical protein [Propionibacteriaceae bacterium]